MKENMWAPWRASYLSNQESEGCLFCELAKEKPSKGKLIVYRTDNCFVVMNKFPYNNGHIMVVPDSHVSTPEQLKKEDFIEFSELIRSSLSVINDVYNPQGCNIGMNIGRSSGAGIHEHIHCHLVPRWTGDTNFMPVFAEVKVISEHLEASYDRIFKGFKKLT